MQYINYIQNGFLYLSQLFSSCSSTSFVASPALFFSSFRLLFPREVGPEEPRFLPAMTTWHVDLIIRNSVFWNMLWAWYGCGWNLLKMNLSSLHNCSPLLSLRKNSPVVGTHEPNAFILSTRKDDDLDTLHSYGIHSISHIGLFGNTINYV